MVWIWYTFRNKLPNKFGLQCHKGRVLAERFSNKLTNKKGNECLLGKSREEVREKGVSRSCHMNKDGERGSFIKKDETIASGLPPRPSPKGTKWAPDSFCKWRSYFYHCVDISWHLQVYLSSRPACFMIRQIHCRSFVEAVC